MPDPYHYDAIILGAGGAGLMCAAVAGQRGRRVLLVDHNAEPGRKILISGGGRCNFTNHQVSPDRFISNNPHFAKSALSRYTPEDFIALVERHGISWHEKTLGQLFCDGSARQIVRMLLAECSTGVDFRFGAAIQSVDGSPGEFQVQVANRKYSAPSMVIACGGPSIPKIGASDYAFSLAKKFTLNVVPPRPALVPMTLDAQDALFHSLSGVATEVIASCQSASFREAALFTHRGLSGPAILQISSYWQADQSIHVNFVPDADADWLLAAKANNPRTHARALIRSQLPARLTETLSEKLSLSGELANLSDKRLRRAQQALSHWEFFPSGTEGYAKAEVTVGGVDTAQLSSKDMQARAVPGLYVIGEAVDVTGWLGGYNFQWAWASGWAAGQAL